MPTILPPKKPRVDRLQPPSFIILAVLIIASATLYFDLRRSASFAAGADEQLAQIASP